MHLTRWITGVAALPFLVVPIVVGGAAFYGLVTVVSLLALREYYRVVFSGTPRSLGHPVTAAAFLAIPAMLLAAHRGSLALVAALFSLNILACALVLIARYRRDPGALELLFHQVTGVAYIALPLAFLVLVRGQAGGTGWIFLILAVVFAGDTFAYHTGSRYGRHKLCPSVSPGKTLEGSLGGLAGNLLAGSLVKALAVPGLPWVEGLVLFALAGVAGQAGDLFESLLKRQADVKDSGSLLPGHGGILDRIDALLFAAPVAYLFHAVLQ